jgi:prolipoprotein diacylglyceryltransferase
MPLASIPSPARGDWHLGLVPVRAYALCIILGIVTAVWMADHRYRRAGGGRGLILDVAAWAVPFGLIGAAAHALLAGAARHGAPHAGLLAAAAAWEGVIGVPGAVLPGMAGAWVACRRAGVRLGPVAGAAAPAVAFGQAIAWAGAWFSQQGYGPPSSLPWAVKISPAHRLPGYENYATFQPVFLYGVLWETAAGCAVLWAARRFVMAGERAFALQMALSCAGILCLSWLRAGREPQVSGVPAGSLVALAVALGALAYLRRTRHRRGPGLAGPGRRVLARRDGPPKSPGIPVRFPP